MHISDNWNTLSAVCGAN